MPPRKDQFVTEVGVLRDLDDEARQHQVLLDLVAGDGTSVHVGDAIATRRNDSTARTDQGEKVRNRQTWTVTATHADGAISARHDERGTVVLPADYVARHIELDRPVTGYGNQGDTVDIGIAVLEGSASRNHAYVAMTRGRHANHALVVDADDATDPGERLTDIITRPSTVESALAVQARLHREAGFEPRAPTSSPPAHPARDRPSRGDPAE